MGLFIHLIATEYVTPAADLIGEPLTDAQVDAAFRAVERGTYAYPDGRMYARTPQNGGWVGAMGITRGPSDRVQAQRTWVLTDANMAASQLTSIEAINAFVERLRQDTATSLDQNAVREGMRPVRNIWTVTATTRTASLPGAAPTVVPPEVTVPIMPAAPSSSAWPLVLGGLAVAGVLALIVYEGDS